MLWCDSTISQNISCIFPKNLPCGVSLSRVCFFFFFALKVPDRHVTLNENICFNQLAVGGQKKIKHREVMWMNPNKYTFLFDWLTDLIIQTPTQSSKTTGPVRETMTVHSWCDPSGSGPPLPTHQLCSQISSATVCSKPTYSHPLTT